MGGCASKPKETDGTTAPAEAPATETVPRENGTGEETHKEAPLVDLSEPKPEGGDKTVEAKEAEPETITKELDALASESTAAPQETKVEAAEEKPKYARAEEATEAAVAKSS
ncbi:hypothetical protein ACJRO7_001523 [Eucalyptus globulus]|uniref:Uncharacterized protein n=1 Tax=Eucalyptus globulus TaxID=34317 RepID=A0ABD3LR82_EUCGL